MNKNLRHELGKKLKEIAQEIRILKEKRREINRRYVPGVKNPLMGYVVLWGKRALRDLPKSKEPLEERYRDLFFKDIKFKSRLSKIKKRIYFLSQEYQGILAQIKAN